MNKYQQSLKDTKELMLDLVEATAEGGCLYVPADIGEILVKKGWGELNETMKDEDGNTAARAIELGIKEFPPVEGEVNTVTGQPAPSEEKVVMQNTSTFKIDDIAVVKKRAVSGNVKYPFDELQIGQSFFVPATVKNPEPWKKLGGAVTSAQNRTAELLFEEDGTTPKMRNKKRVEGQVQCSRLTRRYAVNKDTVDGVVGARVGRIEL